MKTTHPSRDPAPRSDWIGPEKAFDAFRPQRALRYLGVGVVCALVHNAVMITGGVAGVHYAPLTLLSFVVVTPTGYLLHTAVTFIEPRSWRTFWRFAAGLATGFPINFAILALLCSGLAVPVAIAAPVATLLLFAWNYASTHWAILGRLG